MFVMVLPHDGKNLMQTNCCTVISRWWHLARNNPSATGNIHTERASFASDKVWPHQRCSAHLLRPHSPGIGRRDFSSFGHCDNSFQRGNRLWVHGKMFEDRSQRECRQEIQRTHEDCCSRKQHTE